MHVHILGICGTFMGSLALLARDLGHTVSGSDANVYPPMSTQLETAGVIIQEGYAASHLQPKPDLVIVGNAMKRGIEAVEYMLNEGIAYTSGPQFLAEQVLQHRHVIAVAGTHGKTTTTTMLAWILHHAGVDTGFLIGGVPLVDSDSARLNKAFTHSSYLGANKHKDNKYENNKQENNKQGYFVIEADEYDSAFFDKRSKFVHYRPNTAILNNLEFDHADIFKDLDAIQTQFHHMIRTIPSNGQIIMPANTPSLETTINKGCWTPIWRTQITDSVIEKKADSSEARTDWQAQLIKDDGSQFQVHYHKPDGSSITAEVNWNMSGRHNVANALVAVAAAKDIGVGVKEACQALSVFAGIKRRMELIADIPSLNAQGATSYLKVYDDFAHHPTAITTTLDGAVKNLVGRRIWAIIEPRSNTMKQGVYKDSLAISAELANTVVWYEPEGLEWGLKSVIEQSDVNNNQVVMSEVQAIIDYMVQYIEQDDAIIIMSNGGFENIHQRLITALSQKS